MCVRILTPGSGQILSKRYLQRILADDFSE
jgi:hypothetical protein